MPAQGPAAGEREALDAFKRALHDEYRRKLETRKERFEEEFSALVAARRVAVEASVRQIRDKQLADFKIELSQAKQAASRELRERVFATMGDLVDELEERIRQKLTSIRGNRKEHALLLNALALEALDVLASPAAVLLVGIGEASLLEKDPRGARVEETESLPIGGAIALDGEMGLRLVDNSLQTRLERLKPIIVESLSRKLSSLVNHVQEPLTELRVP